jgi:hypothetical protein
MIKKDTIVVRTGVSRAYGSEYPKNIGDIWSTYKDHYDNEAYYESGASASSMDYRLANDLEIQLYNKGKRNTGEIGGGIIEGVIYYRDTRSTGSNDAFFCQVGYICKASQSSTCSMYTYSGRPDKKLSLTKSDFRVASPSECEDYQLRYDQFQEFTSQTVSDKPIPVEVPPTGPTEIRGGRMNFIKGAYIVLTQDHGLAFKKDDIFKQRKDYWYLKVELDSKGGTLNGRDAIKASDNKNWRAATQDEIDRYNKNGGPCSCVPKLQEFKKDEYIVSLYSSGSGGFIKNYVYKQRESRSYLRAYLDNKGSRNNGTIHINSQKPDTFRRATVKEIACYDSHGKPMDTGALIKSGPSFLVGDYIVCLVPDTVGSFKSGYTFKQRETMDYLRPEKDIHGVTTNGYGKCRAADNSTFRYATAAEVIYYDKLERPCNYELDKKEGIMASEKLIALVPGKVYRHSEGTILRWGIEDDSMCYLNHLHNIFSTSPGGYGTSTTEKLSKFSEASAVDEDWLAACENAQSYVERPSSVFKDKSYTGRFKVGDKFRYDTGNKGVLVIEKVDISLNFPYSTNSYGTFKQERLERMERIPDKPVPVAVEKPKLSRKYKAGDMFQGTSKVIKIMSVRTFATSWPYMDQDNVTWSANSLDGMQKIVDEPATALKYKEGDMFQSIKEGTLMRVINVLTNASYPYSCETQGTMVQGVYSEEELDRKYHRMSGGSVNVGMTDMNHMGAMGQDGRTISQGSVAMSPEQVNDLQIKHHFPPQHGAADSPFPLDAMGERLEILGTGGDIVVDSGADFHWDLQGPGNGIIDQIKEMSKVGNKEDSVVYKPLRKKVTLSLKKKR